MQSAMLISAQNMSDANESVIGLHPVRNEHARDSLTIFLEKCRVKFVYPDEQSEVLTRRWCKICK